MATHLSVMYPLVLALSQLVACAGSTSEISSAKTNMAGDGLRESNVNTAQEREPDGESVRSLITSLSSEEDKVRTATERRLISIARTSPDKREVVIQALLKSVGEQEELNGSRTVLSPSALSYWDSATRVFTELKADEAIDVMIKCIHCGNGYTGSLNEQPAADALLRMGARAVPKLADALAKDGNAYKRVQIVLCLSRINTPQAKRALEHALRSEPDKGVRTYIENALGVEEKEL
jgi:HEAT repeat protein